VITTIPTDFPSNIYQSSLAGAQPKIAVVEVDGKYYPEGNTPAQKLERYLMCEDLAKQGLAYCLRKIEDGTVVDPNAALLRLHSGLQSKNWCTQQQKVWIVNRVAVLGNWSKPLL
jgi:hypothetical protein